MKPRKLRRRRLGGVWMQCLSPGSWLSESGTIAVMLMMENTTHEEWELYLTKLATGAVSRVPRDPDTVDFLCADYWCGAFTFGELSGDVRKLADWAHNLGRNLALTCERQTQDLRWGFGPPDPSLGWYPNETGRKARQPSLR